MVFVFKIKQNYLIAHINKKFHSNVNNVIYFKDIMMINKMIVYRQISVLNMINKDVYLVKTI